MKKRIVAIIQARMGSTRLPGKVMADLCGMPMLAVLLHRLKMVHELDEIVVATTNRADDDPLVNWLKEQNVKYFRGSQDDVLERFWCCAKENSADIIVRITADDPLKAPEIISHAIQLLVKYDSIDYVSNTLEPTFPEGLDVEVFSFLALDRAHNKANLKSEREHVTPYIWKNLSIFNIKQFGMSPNLSSWRLTVDKMEDLQFVRKLLSFSNNDIEISAKEIFRIFEENPELALINSNTVRNEGYLKSLRMENKIEK